MISNIAAKPAAAPSFRTGDERLIKLTESAAKKVGTLLTKQGRPNGVLRVAVVGGGCSGLQYKMDLQDGPANRDILVESAGVRVVQENQKNARRKNITRHSMLPTIACASPKKGWRICWSWKRAQSQSRFRTCHRT